MAAKTIGEHHKLNLYAAAQVIIGKELEGDGFRVQLPKESARLETLSYGEAESLLVKANDSNIKVTTYLAQAAAALAYFRRFASMKEKSLMGDPELQAGAKNEAQRERNMMTNAEYQDIMVNLRTAEEVVAYLEHISSQAKETLQVVKKVREAAYERNNPRPQPQY
jgi:hypothetical protein